jgi:hypothetical protein
LLSHIRRFPAFDKNLGKRAYKEPPRELVTIEGFVFEEKYSLTEELLADLALSQYLDTFHRHNLMTVQSLKNLRVRDLQAVSPAEHETAKMAILKTLI